MEQLLDKGKVTRGYLAVLLQDIDENLAKALKLSSTQGALVADVISGGPGDKAGIKRGDIIIEMNGKKIENTIQSRNMVAQMKPGTSVKFTLLRDGKKIQVTAVLEERPKDVKGQIQQESESEEQTSQKLGMVIQTLTPEIAQQLGYQNEKGVVITDVTLGSSADDAGLKQGDLIQEVNRVKIESVQDFNDAVKTLNSGDSVALLIRRGQNTIYVAIQIP
jgi:serine protease Do